MKSFSNYQKGPRIPILMYHEVSEVTERRKKTRSTNPAYALSIKQFHNQMNYLHKNGYQTLSLNELLNNKTPAYQRSLIITFDDGWANNHTNAFPILREHGLSATIFIITGFIGQSDYLDWNQLREMDKEGMSIQSHTVSHKPLVGFPRDQLMYELDASKKSIEDNLGKQVDFLSVPHGMINRKVVDMARTLGYKAICTTEPGFSHRYGDPAIFKRINISDRYQIDTFEKIVQINRTIILSLIFFKKIKNLTRKVLGYNNYRKVYRFLYRIGE